MGIVYHNAVHKILYFSKKKKVGKMKYLFSACFATSQIKCLWLTFMLDKTWCIFFIFHCRVSVCCYLDF